MEQPSTSTAPQYRELFTVALRILGAYHLFEALHEAGTLVNILTAHYRPQTSSAGSWALYTVIDILIGIYLLRGAPGLVNYAYRERPRMLADLPTDQEPNEEEAQ